MAIQIENFDYQEQALYHGRKYGSLVAGRQVGKTEAAKNWIIENLLETETSGLWVDVRNANLDKYVERYFKPTLKDYWTDKTYNQQKKILRLPNGSFIDFGSAESPEAMEGFNYGFVVINEAGIILKKPELWYQTIEPMCKRAKVRFVGTPKGKNLFHKIYTKGLNGHDPNYLSYRVSCYDSPLWTKEMLDDIRKNTPEVIFKQEYEAQFLANGGTVFRKVDGCIRPIELVNAGDPAKRYIMAFDLAKHNDFTVIFIADELTKEVVYFDRFNQVDWPLQKHRIFSAWQAFGQCPAIMDSTGVGDSIYDDLVALGMTVEGFKFTSTSKKEIIENLIVSIENQQIFFPPIPELMAEMDVFEYQVSRSRNVSYNAPDGLHDDCVIALALLNSFMRVNQSFVVMTA